LKLGTLAPAGTSYHKSLQAMGEKWRKASDGAVQLVIFPGGTQGSEADMVGLMQTGNLDAGLLTTGGLAEIDPAALAMQVMPMFFRNSMRACWPRDTSSWSGAIPAGCASSPRRRYCIRMTCGS